MQSIRTIKRPNFQQGKPDFSGITSTFEYKVCPVINAKDQTDLVSERMDIAYANLVFPNNAIAEDFAKAFHADFYNTHGVYSVDNSTTECYLNVVPMRWNKVQTPKHIEWAFQNGGSVTLMGFSIVSGFALEEGIDTTIIRPGQNRLNLIRTQPVFIESNFGSNHFLHYSFVEGVDKIAKEIVLDEIYQGEPEYFDGTVTMLVEPDYVEHVIKCAFKHGAFQVVVIEQ